MLKYKWLLLITITLVVLESVLVGGIGVWREYFWTSIEQKALSNFLRYLSYFTGLALGICIISGLTTYLISYISLLIRQDLTKVALTKNYGAIEGGEQRIQEDCRDYPFYGLTIGIGIVRNILSFFIFAAIIIFQVGLVYLLILLLYTTVGTFLAWKVGRPLITLNYLLQAAEASWRRYVMNTGLNSPLVRSSTVDKVEFKPVFKINKKLFIVTKKLTYFQSFYNQITVIVPYLILFPLYFSSKIVFGVFMQVASSVSHVVDSLSYIINSFNEINNWLSCRRRLKELGVI